MKTLKIAATLFGLILLTGCESTTRFGGVPESYAATHHRVTSFTTTTAPDGTVTRNCTDTRGDVRFDQGDSQCGYSENATTINNNQQIGIGGNTGGGLTPEMRQKLRNARGGGN